MTLISLLLVLSIERIAIQSQMWQADAYFDKYQNIIQQRGWLSDVTNSANAWFLFGVIFIPSVFLYVLLQQVDSSLLSLVIETAILMVCVGCPTLRATYKCFLQAANRGDMQACSMYADQLGHDDSGPRSFGQNLIWLNYQHYAAVVIWFAAFGAAGSVLYVLARGFSQKLEEMEHPLAGQASTLIAILDWIPVRITALGFLLVGHFSRALPIWIGYLPDPSVSAKQLLADVSKAAEEIEPDEHDCTEEPCTLVRLAKRNIMFILVAISLLTLSGWID